MTPVLHTAIFSSNVVIKTSLLWLVISRRFNVKDLVREYSRLFFFVSVSVSVFSVKLRGGGVGNLTRIFFFPKWTCKRLFSLLATHPRAMFHIPNCYLWARKLFLKASSIEYMSTEK